MYKAHLVSITAAESVPPNLKGFVTFQASLEDHEVQAREKVALLVIEGTSSYVVFFLGKVKDVEEIERRLREQQAEMTVETRAILEKNLGN